MSIFGYIKRLTIDVYIKNEFNKQKKGPTIRRNSICNEIKNKYLEKNLIS